eukprot:scaffold19285_cov80-Skeletonema_marinoi.AAC.5
MPSARFMSSPRTLSREREGENRQQYRGIARTIPPGGYKNFRLGWVCGVQAAEGVREAVVTVLMSSHSHQHI